MSKYVIDSSTLTDIADAIRSKTGSSSAIATEDMADEIGGIKSGGIEPPETEYWVRPEGAPDLDALLKADTHTSVLYFTVDNVAYVNKKASATIASSATTYQEKHFERGHVENGVFIVDEKVVFSNNQAQNIYQDMQNPWGDYPVFRVWIETNSRLTSFSLNTEETFATELVMKTDKSWNMQGMISRFVKRVRIDGAPSQFSIGARAPLLQKIDISDTSQMTAFNGMFVECYNLTEVNTQDWDVRNVENFASMFRSCRKLKNIDLSSWENNKSADCSRMFEWCTSLEEVNFGSSFKVKPTALGSLFYHCVSLQKVSFPPWDTSSATNMSGMFSDCRSLSEINGAQYLDTSGISSANNFFNFNECNRLAELPEGLVLDISGTSGIGGFSILNGYNFREMDYHDRITPTNKITAPPYINYDWFLDRIDYHGWDTSNFTTFSANWASADAVPRYVNLSGWDLTHMSTVSTWNKNSTVEFYPPIIAISHSYNNMVSLDHASRLRILNVLPVTSNTVTLTLGNVKYDLMDAELAIATQKGWTVA